MDQIGTKAVNWPLADVTESTLEPDVSMSAIEEEVPTLTVATLVGVTIAIVIAIVVVFLLGVLIDWRQQRLLEKQMGKLKRLKSQKRVNILPECDDVSIVNNMEGPGTSAPPGVDLPKIVVRPD